MDINKEITDEILVNKTIKFAFRYLKDRKMFCRYIDAFNVYKTYKEDEFGDFNFTLRRGLLSECIKGENIYDKIVFLARFINITLYWELTKDGWEYWNAVNTDFKEYYKKYFKL